MVVVLLLLIVLCILDEPSLFQPGSAPTLKSAPINDAGTPGLLLINSHPAEYGDASSRKFMAAHESMETREHDAMSLSRSDAGEENRALCVHVYAPLFF